MRRVAQYDLIRDNVVQYPIIAINEPASERSITRVLRRVAARCGDLRDLRWIPAGIYDGVCMIAATEDNTDNIVYGSPLLWRSLPTRGKSVSVGNQVDEMWMWASFVVNGVNMPPQYSQDVNMRNCMSAVQVPGDV